MDDIIPQDTPLKQCSQCKKFFPATPTFFTRAKNQKCGLRPECKKCKKISMKAYNDAHVEDHKRFNQEHKEEKREYNKQYRETHLKEIKEQKKHKYQLQREQILEEQRTYRKTHRELVREQRKQGYKKHRKQVRASQSLYRKTHLEHAHEQDRRYYKAYRERIRVYNKYYRKTERGILAERANANNRRAYKKAIEGILTPQQIQDKLRLQHYRCYYAPCGHAKFEKRNGKYVFQIEHTIPISRTEHNPRHDVNYVVLSCPSCNSSKRNRLPHEWLEGGRLF